MILHAMKILSDHELNRLFRESWPPVAVPEEMYMRIRHRVLHEVLLTLQAGAIHRGRHPLRSRRRVGSPTMSLFWLLAVGACLLLMLLAIMYA
jgi:hypothetical protein